MRNLIILILSIVVFLYSTNAQILEYSFKLKTNILKQKQTNFYLNQFYLPINITLPQGLRPTQIKVFYNNAQNFNNVRLYLHTYQPTQASPSEPIEIKKFARYNHLKINQLYGIYTINGLIVPIDYRKSQLTVYQDIIIQIKTTKYTAYFIFQPPPWLSSIDSIAYTEETLDYLIITRDKFIPEFTRLTSYYKSKGYRVKIESYDKWLKSFTGTDTVQLLQDIINQYLEQTGVQYVLIGGDADIMPFRYFYAKVISPNGIYESNKIPADIYFAAPGQWDSKFDDNEIFGEEGEEQTIIPIALGRLPFSNEQELKVMIDRIILYQESIESQHNNDFLLVGELLWTDPLTYGAQYLNLLIGNQYVNYFTKGIFPENDIDSLYERQFQWDTLTLINQINNDYNIIFHSGHSNSSMIMKMHKSTYSSGIFSNLELPPVFYSHGCYAGSFPVDDCVSEEMMKPEGFITAAVVNSHYGWFNEGQLDGPSIYLNRMFVDAIFGKGMLNIGAAFTYSKNKIASLLYTPNQYEYGANRWVYYDNTLLGDPVMKLWTKSKDLWSKWLFSYTDTVKLGDSVAICLSDSLPVRAVLIDEGKILWDNEFLLRKRVKIPTYPAISLDSAIILLQGANLPDTQLIVYFDTADIKMLKVQLLTDTVEIFGQSYDTITIKLLLTPINPPVKVVLGGVMFNQMKIFYEVIEKDTTISFSFINQSTLINNQIVSFKFSTEFDDKKFIYSYPITIKAPVPKVEIQTSFCDSKFEHNIQLFNFGPTNWKPQIKLITPYQTYVLNTNVLPNDTTTVKLPKFENKSLFIGQLEISNNYLKTSLFYPIAKPQNFTDTSILNSITLFNFKSTTTELCSQKALIPENIYQPGSITLEIFNYKPIEYNQFGFTYHIDNQIATLKFYLNDQLIFTSDTAKINAFSCSIPAGYNKLKWSYVPKNYTFKSQNSLPPLMLDQIFIPETTQILTKDNKIKLYPNPASDFININILSKQDASLEIYNSLGQKIFEKQFNTSTIINITALESGIYFVKIQTSNNELLFGKFIKL